MLILLSILFSASFFSLLFRTCSSSLLLLLVFFIFIVTQVTRKRIEFYAHTNMCVLFERRLDVRKEKRSKQMLFLSYDCYIERKIVVRVCVQRKLQSGLFRFQIKNDNHHDYVPAHISRHKKNQSET